MTVYAARDSVLVNSRAPDPVYQCQLCFKGCVDRALHLKACNELFWTIFRTEGADISVFFSEVRS